MPAGGGRLSIQYAFIIARGKFIHNEQFLPGRESRHAALSQRVRLTVRTGQHGAAEDRTAAGSRKIRQAQAAAWRDGRCGLPAPAFGRGIADRVMRFRLSLRFQ